MASVTDICNLALSARLGQDTIASTTEDSNEARKSLLFYPMARAFVNGDAVWRHGKKLLTGAEADNDRPDDWAYAYERPSDCLRFRFMLPSSGGIQWKDAVPCETFADLIYSDEPAARLFYQVDITDTTKFSPAFINTLGWYLAHLLVMPLKIDAKLMADMLNGYRTARSNAIATDAAEDIFVPDLDYARTDWLEARN